MALQALSKWTHRIRQQGLRCYAIRHRQTQEGCLTTYSVSVNNLQKQCATDGNNTTVEADLQTVEQPGMKPTYYAQELWTCTPRCGSVYTEMTLKASFVEIFYLPTCRTLHHWWLEHQSALLYSTAQRAELITYLRGSKFQPDNQSDSDRTGSCRDPRRNRSC